ncbi:unnamed protein product [Allacma fusca]|uniref:Uncharacterized protein n=1 Tax=Allacma fusca TaxID=39272 RepID=A0A8J2P453_9HEXA|nr:unnamed protein product [Allacma fusca]
MEPAEISLLLLRHLARDGCVETIRTYVNECPAVMQSLTVASGGAHPDLEFFRQKLLNRSVNINLTDLLSEYGRAKSMIQDLVSKLLFEWKALSTYFLSPHDSMATQLAHITNLLESKCKSCRTDSKCVGTSDDHTFAGLSSGLGQHLRKDGIDVGVQTSEEEAESAVEIAEEPSDIPTIVSSLLDPPMIEKIVEIANKEKLNRSNQSENILANDTETEIDKMLLDILHGMGGNPIPSNALNLGCNSTDSAANDQTSVDPQLMDLFQYAQSTIVHTPVPGTLVRLEDSVSKQKPCGSFLDLIDTPFKSAFISIPNTPVGKVITQTEVEKPLEKPIQPVELNFGPSISVTPGVPDVSSNTKSGFITKPKPEPKYSIVRGSESQVPAVSQELLRVRKKRDITPRIPPTVQFQATTTEIASTSNASLVRSTSKRKFNTPMKLSPVKAMLAPSVNFYCPSSSLDKLSSSSKTDVQTSSIETPLKILPTVGLPSIATPLPPTTIPSSGPGDSELTIIKSPLATINYQDLMDNANQSKKSSTTNKEVTSTTKPATADSTKKHTPVSGSSKSMAANMITPELGLLEKSSNENPDVSPTPMYSRLLASVRHARPSSMLLKQKSFSTPRKKGHIRNLMFKTPPSATSERTENSSINFSGNLSGKRKATPSPPLGSKSKKRLKWNSLLGETKNNSSSVIDESAPILPPTNPSPPTSQIMADIASRIVGQNVVSTRSRSARNSQANVKSAQKTTRQTRGTTSKKIEESPNVAEALPVVSVVSPPSISVVSPPVTSSSRRSSKRLDDQRAADAAVISAIPLGARNFPSRSRVTRGKSKLNTCEQMDQNQPVDPRGSIWMAQTDVKNVDTIPPPSGFGDSSSIDSHQPEAILHTIKIPAVLNPQDAQVGKSPITPPKLKQEEELSIVVDKVSNNPAALASVLVSPPRKEVTKDSVNDKKHRTRVRKGSTEIQNKNGSEVSKECVKIKPADTILSELVTKPFASTPLVSANEGRKFVHLGDHQKKTPFPNLTSSLNSTRDANVADTVSNVGTTLVTENITRISMSTKPSLSPCSPSRGRPRSPRKSPNKNPRRILPKPVPPDHPRPVFPPPNQNSGYILSIPSTSPAKDNDDSLTVPRTFISPLTLVSETPLKKPGLTLSSSDSSLELSNSVPKTPRLKHDSCEDTTTSRLFLGIRNDSISVGAGIPIFSSTPLKFPPETPGKNLPVGGGAVVIEGDSSTRTSLFDTPIKLPTPPKATSFGQQNLEVSIQKIATKSVEFSENLSSLSVIPRKSPRKSISPLKCRVKTPRKAKTPIKSVQKLPTKTSFEYKPTRRTPYKSPLLKKKSASPCRKSFDEEEKVSVSSENQIKSSSDKSAAKCNTTFATLCTKSRSFMRLSEVARRGKSNLSANSNVTSFPSGSSAPFVTVPVLSKEGKNNGKPVKPADVHFQFAVSGRTKQLSLSEHESLIGLLQIGSIKSQQKKQPRCIQKLDADLLSNIDLHKFLRTVHAVSQFCHILLQLTVQPWQFKEYS